MSRSSAGYNLDRGMSGCIITFVSHAAAEDGRNADGSTKARIHIRKNPGFRLLKETFAKEFRADATCRLSLTKHGGAIRFGVDGETLLEAVHDQPWPEGLMRCGHSERTCGETTFGWSLCLGGPRRSRVGRMILLNQPASTMRNRAGGFRADLSFESSRRYRAGDSPSSRTIFSPATLA